MGGHASSFQPLSMAVPRGAREIEAPTLILEHRTSSPTVLTAEIRVSSHRQSEQLRSRFLLPRQPSRQGGARAITPDDMGRVRVVIFGRHGLFRRAWSETCYFRPLATPLGCPAVLLLPHRRRQWLAAQAAWLLWTLTARCGALCGIVFLVEALLGWYAAVLAADVGKQVAR